MMPKAGLNDCFCPAPGAGLHGPRLLCLRNSAALCPGPPAHAKFSRTTPRTLCITLRQGTTTITVACHKNFPPIVACIGTVGQTSSQFGEPEAFGITATTVNGGQVVEGFDFIGQNNSQGYSVLGGSLSYGSTFGAPSVGVWLVTPAPEPGTWAILSLGAVMLFGISRRQNRRQSSQHSADEQTGSVICQMTENAVPNAVRFFPEPALDDGKQAQTKSRHQ
jgi:hypothetical protein